MMKYIAKEKLIAFAKDHPVGIDQYDIEKFPIEENVMPVVHCRDCVAYQGGTGLFDYNVCTFHNSVCPEDGFCNFGQRKD